MECASTIPSVVTVATDSLLLIHAIDLSIAFLGKIVTVAEHFPLLPVQVHLEKELQTSQEYSLVTELYRKSQGQ